MTQVLISGRSPNGQRPVIAWRNLLLDGTVTASGEDGDNPKENAFDGIGTDYWRPNAAGANWIEAELATPEDVDYVAVARHTLGSDAATCVLQYHDGVDWVDLHDPLLPEDDDVFLVLFDSGSATRIRFWFDSLAQPYIGALSFGRRTTLEQGIFAGHKPEKLNRVTRSSGGRTEGGAFLPSNIVRQGTESSIDITHLSASFVQSEIEPFMRHAEARKPFFWAWRPESYPTQVVWAKASGDPSCTPTQPGGPQERGFWQLTCGIRGVFR